jgi:hypothetical protein
MGPFSEWYSMLAKWLAAMALATAPGGIITLAELPQQGRQYLLPGLCVAAITHLALAAWYIRRFGRISELEIRSPKTAEIGPGQLDWLGPPRRSPFTAIAWKQWRESGPLALVGMAVMYGLVAMFLAMNWHNSYVSYSKRGFVGLVVGASASIGFAIAMIVGIGAFLSDVGSGINTFWRSRPINPDLWFWTKYLGGLAILLAAIYGPIVLVESPLISLFYVWPLGSAVPVLAAMTVATFASAVAMTCLVRNAVYAAIVSIAVVHLGITAVAFTLAVARSVRGEAWPENTGHLFDMTALQIAAGLLLSFIVSTLIAWLAVRYDWGRKSRY